MFVENYRNDDSLMAGGDAQPTIPYPKLSGEDWRAWKLFLPFRSASIDGTTARAKESLYFSYGIPYSLTGEIQKATQYFDQVEIWRKHEVQKDPIAVGVLGSDHYLIARWGMEKLLPFNTMKKAVPLILAWKVIASPAGVIGTAAMGYLAWAFLM